MNAFNTSFSQWLAIKSLKPKANVLSLFDGISAGHLALDRAGIEVGTYYRSEIDKFANKVAMHHYPDDVQLGDVIKWREWDIDWASIDMLIGGSPCQGFSFAGKQLAFDDPRSALFFVYVDILNHIKSFNPNVKFMLENVKMKKEFVEVINEHLGVEPVVINSALMSAQNRVRLYWCNWDLKQPEDKGILLRDVIQGGAVDREKSYCLDASYAKGGNLEQYQNKCRRQIVFTSDLRPCERIKDGNEGHIANATDFKAMESTKRIYGADGKAPTLTTMGGGHREPKVLINDVQYRKLTPTECARLQTFPDGWAESIVSNSQAYKAYGNSWTVDVVGHIFKSLVEVAV